MCRFVRNVRDLQMVIQELSNRYLFVSDVLWFVIVEMFITVTLSLLLFTKMMLLSVLKAERQLQFLTHVSET